MINRYYSKERLELKSGRGGRFASTLPEYFHFRFALVKESRHQRNVTSRFARFLDKRRARAITHALVLEFLNECHERYGSRTVRFNTNRLLRPYCQFLAQRDPIHYVPAHRLVPRPKSTLEPHIFSEDQVRAMMYYARHFLWKGDLKLIVPAVYETLIGLLWATGMRISEAVNLNLGDVDWEQGIITIRETKFYKSRLIPVHPSTLAALRAYVAERNSFGFPQRPERPFFFNWRMRGGTKRGRYTEDAFHHKIRQIILALKIHNRAGQPPRPYDLRHSFASHRLTFVCDRKEAARLLPVVSVYMGHAKISYTQVYLHPSMQLMIRLGNSFLNYFESEIQTAATDSSHCDPAFSNRKKAA